MAQKEIYLIDGSAYIHRAYHAITPLSNSHGLPTHAVYGFTTIIRRIVRERQPDYLAVAFDTKGPVFRHKIYQQYKANRPPMPDDLAVQIPYIRKMVQSYNILSLEHNDQEADDLIASVTMRLSAQGFRVVIVSGDKDLLQLVGEKVTCWDPMSDRLMDLDQIEKKYGMHPDLLLDYFALTGDTSDNIPGVPGVGPKTAQKLISEYKTLEELYAHVDEMKKSKLKERLLLHRDDAFLSRELIRLNRDVKVPENPEEYRVRQPDADSLRKLLTELEFYTLLKSDVPARQVDSKGFLLVQSEPQLEDLVRRLEKAELIVIDTETNSLDLLSAELVGLSICIDECDAWYIPCGHRDVAGDLSAGQLPLDRIIQALRPFLEQPGLPKIGHNLKFDWSILSAPHNGGINLAGPLFDTMIGAWLLDPGRRSYKLDDLCLDLDLRMITFAEVTEGDKSEDCFTRVALEKAKDYSCEDVYGALLIFKSQRSQLEQAGLWNLFQDLECPLIPVLARMEMDGIGIDGEMLDELADEFGKKLQGLEEEIYCLAGRKFNINSPPQLGEILFEELLLPKGRKTKTGYSTDVKVLERLCQHHDLPKLILTYRNMAKLKSTYVDRLSQLARIGDGRVHTSYNQCGTTTGRLSSSNPNLQNIPIRTEDGQRIRSAFVAAPGCSLLSGDYSQIDLRVLAHYSKDRVLLESFHANEDIHSRTAAEIFFVSPALITPEMRRVAKTINFGIVYGMSSYGLSSQLNISRKEAQTFIDRYLARYQGVREFMESIVAKARIDGYVTTLLGRRRILPDIQHPNRTRREFAERTAINTPVQGTAADIIKLAMLQVDREIREQNLGAKMILQIHDELVLEVPENEIRETGNLLRAAMENVIDLEVPLQVNIAVSKNLATI
ncbi:MAG: DNA polymerase I [Desulfobulbaceae bacterium]|nr:DNA polymerase I [Desulfobulbaceae bacterium]